MQLIETAFSEYHRRTCIRFKPRSNEHDYISLVNGNTGCWSSVGRVGGKQVSESMLKIGSDSIVLKVFLTLSNNIMD